MNFPGSTEDMKACCVVDGKVTDKYDVKFENGNAVFTVPHLSTYALMKESATESGSEDYSVHIVGVIAAVALIGGVIAFVKFKKA